MKGVSVGSGSFAGGNRISFIEHACNRIANIITTENLRMKTSLRYNTTKYHP
jgi:hypothetical protein